MEVAELFSVKGLVAVVTGGGSGIGRAMVHAFAANGAEKVFILGRRLEALQECATFNPNVIIPIQCDITSKTDLQRSADRVQQEVGYLNVLICNSGTGGPESTKLGPTSTLDDFIKINWEHDVEDYVKTFEVNTAGYWYTSLAFLKLLHLGNEKKNIPQRSQVIATCSTLGFGRLAPTARFAYGQSKAASTHLMKQLSTSLVPYGIRANILAPGLFMTEMTSVMTSTSYDVGKLVPEGRAGEDQDIAGMILYLTSKAGAYLNGSVLVCDGGRLGVVPSSY
ncbi:hypothetical protein ZTR_02484 [Talaromyces verruculosus]|nr:hypothetical protein ZTR_02484 [Talaromyces verruculosus]